MRAIGLARLPVFRSTVNEVVRLIAEVKTGASTGPT